MRNLFIFISIFFCLQLQAEVQKDSVNSAKTEDQQDKADKNKSKIVYIISTDVADITDTTYYVATNKDSIGLHFVKKEDNVEVVTKEWYEETWAIYTIIGVAGVGFILSLISVVLFFMKTSDDFDDDNYVTKDSLRHKLDDHIRDYHTQNNLSIAQQSKYTKDIDDLKKKIYSLEVQISRTQSAGVVKQSTERIVEKQPSKDVQLQNKPQVQPKQPTAKHLYACQDASDKIKLRNVSETFDKFTHTFDITLDANSTTTGNFIIVEDKYVQESCLNNSDSILCCSKEGSGSTIKSQRPGRVSINGNTAIVTLPVKIILS